MSDTPTKTKGRAKKDDYIVQGSILAAAAVLTKIIGVVYRIPLTNILGDEGNGFYGYAYQVYAIALMISSFSLPTAVSKLVSVRLAKRQKRNAFPGISVFPCICSGSRFIYFADDFPGGGTDLYPCDEIPVKCLCTPCTCTGLADRCGNGGHPWIFSGNGDDDSDGYFTDH